MSSKPNSSNLDLHLLHDNHDGLCHRSDRSSPALSNTSSWSTGSTNSDCSKNATQLSRHQPTGRVACVQHTAAASAATTTNTSQLDATADADHSSK